ncbi:MAG: hypothetical protein GY906_04085, partial [bacterium]|nr:hypothetical protein [bacterium]
GSAVQAPVDDDGVLGAGFRYSVYGPSYDPGPGYWASVGRQMAGSFEEAVPEAVWIVGRLFKEGCQLSFPVEASDPLIQGVEEDRNEEVLSLFDAQGFRVWLQVEPGNAPVDELLRLVMARYGHHPSVIGAGVDVEWYQSVSQPDGKAVSDAEARAWLDVVRSINPEYRLFLKHWEIGKMPPNERDGLMFIDDSQMLPSLEAMVAEFAEWGRAFAPAPVGFQYGYPRDKEWWGELENPPQDIGAAIVADVPNTRGLYWVDFTVLELFPPQQMESPVVVIEDES